MAVRAWRSLCDFDCLGAVRARRSLTCGEEAGYGRIARCRSGTTACRTARICLASRILPRGFSFLSSTFARRHCEGNTSNNTSNNTINKPIPMVETPPMTNQERVKKHSQTIYDALRAFTPTILVRALPHEKFAEWHPRFNSNTIDY